jgi:hypothetical protein
MIIALAGRRIDAPDAKEARFPNTPENIETVRTRIRTLLQTEGATLLVCSAACGADLLALSEAARLGLRRRIVLPFAPEKFRKTSVTDRGGDWGPLYDALIEQAQENRDLLEIQPTAEDKAYVETNHAIIQETLSLGRQFQLPFAAALVWDGKSRGEGDVTAEFGAYARQCGMRIVEVKTCGPVAAAKSRSGTLKKSTKNL